jgi:tetratricopeptide (TPR) repeat protein
LNGDREQFTINSDQLLEQDPLNHFVKAENYFIANDGTHLPANIQNEFMAETMLEVALQYYNLARMDDALAIMDLAGEDTKVKLWKAFLMRATDSGRSTRLLTEVIEASPEFVHPFRRESVRVLEWAHSQSTNWKFKYYLAQNYLAVGLKEKATALLKAIGDQADSDVFYRFRAKILDDLPYEKRLKDYETALKLSETDWKVWEEFIQFHLSNSKYEAAYELSSKAYKKFRDNYNIGLSHAKAALQVDRYSETIEVLQSINILPFEHASESKKIYDDAHIYLAKENMEKNRFKEAIALLEASREWPENLGVGKPYDVDSRLQDYLLAISYEKIGDPAKAKQLLVQVADFTKLHRDRHSINHLFGLLALERMGKKVEAGQMLTYLKGSNTENGQGVQLAIAFFENDKEALSRLKGETSIPTELWQTMQISRDL